MKQIPKSGFEGREEAVDLALLKETQRERGGLRPCELQCRGRLRRRTLSYWSSCREEE